MFSEYQSEKTTKERQRKSEHSHISCPLPESLSVWHKCPEPYPILARTYQQIIGSQKTRSHPIKYLNNKAYTLFPNYPFLLLSTTLQPLQATSLPAPSPRFPALLSSLPRQLVPTTAPTQPSIRSPRLSRQPQSPDPRTPARPPHPPALPARRLESAAHRRGRGTLVCAGPWRRAGNGGEGSRMSGRRE